MSEIRIKTVKWIEIPNYEYCDLLEFTSDDSNYKSDGLGGFDKILYSKKGFPILRRVGETDKKGRLIGKRYYKNTRARV